MNKAAMRVVHVVVTCLLAAGIARAGTWEAGTSLTIGRTQARAVNINGRIYVVGGAADDGTSDRIDVYDPLPRTWTSLTSMPTGSIAPQCVAAIGGSIYVISDYRASFLKYDRRATRGPCSPNRQEQHLYGLAGRAQPSTTASISSAVLSREGPAP
jgi:N-acetylneuraminic acid mutarotase